METYKHHRFKVQQSKPSNKIYLTEAEIEAIIHALDLSSDPWLEKERDRFLVTYYFFLCASRTPERSNSRTSLKNEVAVT